MPITKLRGDTQIKTGTISSSEIRDFTILPEDLAPNSFSGAMFIEGTIPLSKLDTNATLELHAGISVDPYADFKEIAGVVKPALGYGRLFVGADKKLHFINDLGEEIILLGESVNVIIIDGGAPDSVLVDVIDGGEPGTIYTTDPIDGGSL